MSTATQGLWTEGKRVNENEKRAGRDQLSRSPATAARADTLSPHGEQQPQIVSQNKPFLPYVAFASNFVTTAVRLTNKVT